MEKEIAQSDVENVDTDGTCRLMIQCLKDSHPTYFVVSSRSDMVGFMQQICATYFNKFSLSNLRRHSVIADTSSGRVNKTDRQRVGKFLPM